MTTATYVPAPGTAGARALHYLQTRTPQGPVPAPELASAIGAKAHALSAILATVMSHKLVVRENIDGKSHWRLGRTPGAHAASFAPPAPPPPQPEHEHESAGAADVLAVSQARVDASTSKTPIPGLRQQSWCPVAQDVEAESSQDEPEPEPCPRPAAPPPLGLGWKAPRTPVFLADGPVGVLEAEEGTSAEPGPAADAPSARDATSANDETVQALTAALAPTPDDDPDFREVDRAQPAIELGDFVRAARAAAARDELEREQGATEGFRCAMWSNGKLEIFTSDGDRVLLLKSDTAALFDYLDKTLARAE